jgi:hypothetical protein
VAVNVLERQVDVVSLGVHRDRVSVRPRVALDQLADAALVVGEDGQRSLSAATYTRC